MAIKVIVELRAKAGMRRELEELLASHVPDEPAYARLPELLAAPFRATVIRELP